MTHFLYVPFTGLGRYNGYRGRQWLKNRIKIFKQFVLPSILYQTNRNFILWLSWRPEDKDNPIIKEFRQSLDSIRDLKVVFTYHGVCFWDDKYEDSTAAQRLMFALLGSLPELSDYIDSDYVYLTIQPSDDLYVYTVIETLQKIEPNPVGQPLKCVGWQQGYIMNYATGELAEYNPDTNPPFYTIIFPKEVFLDAKKHFDQTGPYKSHEYVVQCMDYQKLTGRGFCVGTHSENISTYFNHPYKGRTIEERDDVLARFGLWQVEPLTITKRKSYFIKLVINKLPYSIRHRILTWYISVYDLIF